MFILLSLITKKDSKNIYRWQFLLFLIILETILEYFLLIERNIAFVLKLLNFGENGCMFLDTSFTKVILSITLLFKWLSRSKRCSSLALDLLFCLEGVLLLMRNCLCVIKRWPSQSKWWMRIQTTRTKMAVKIFTAIGSFFHIITIQTSSPHAGWKLWSWAHIVLFKVSYKFIYHYSLWSCRKDFAKIWTKKLRNVIHRQAWHAEACLEPYRHWWCPYIIGYLKSEAD